jgi:hypothetical protein
MRAASRARRGLPLPAAEDRCVSSFAVTAYVIGLTLVIFERASSGLRIGSRIPRIGPRSGTTLLVAIFAAQLALVAYAAHHHVPTFDWERLLPLPVAHDDGPVIVHADLVGAAMAMLGVGASLVLACLYVELGRHGVGAAGTRWICAGAGVMALLALAAPALTSADVYSNVGYALLGGAAYTPPDRAFDGAFAVINRWWGTPMVPAPYGPLWLALLHLTTAVPTLAAKLESLRILGLASLGAFIAALAWMRMPPRLIVMAALNPALWLQFVANAHNDMLAVLCVTLGAALTMRAQVLPAVACIVAAGLIKAPYAVLGLLIFTGLRRPASRYATMSASLALTALLSVWLGGAPYLAALMRHVVSRTGPEFVLHALAALVAAVILLAALLGFGRLRSGAFLMPALAAALFPWYLAWSIPYALSRQRDLAYLLVAFPAAAALLDTVFFRGFIGLGALVLTLACAILLTLRNRSRPILDAG